MIQEELARNILKNINSFGLSPSIDVNYHKFKDTLKPCLLDIIEWHPVTIESDNKLKIEIEKEEFKKALFSDFYFGLTRIKEQVKNVNHLLDAGSQVSWIITTTYYACYFMAIELAKLHGNFIINFSKDEFAKILIYSKDNNGFSLVPEVNNSFKVSLSGNNQNFLNLNLIKEGSKPHQIVWLNLYGIIKNLNVNDGLLHHKNLIMAICDAKNDRWKFPSAIRNEWNYTYASYYSDKGTELGETFLSIIKKHDSAMGWANRRTIRPDEKNIPASIAYLYHCLFRTIEIIDNRLNQ